jgi:serine/threonine-protein kinase SRPK3
VSVLKETIWNGQYQDNLVRLIDYFYHPAQGPSRGEHACLVFEILGPNLLSFLEAHVETVRLRKGDAVPGEAGGLPLNLVKEFAKQMLAGIAYLHDFCRHIHTDLKVSSFEIFPSLRILPCPEHSLLFSFSV